MQAPTTSKPAAKSLRRQQLQLLLRPSPASHHPAAKRHRLLPRPPAWPPGASPQMMQTQRLAHLTSAEQHRDRQPTWSHPREMTQRRRHLTSASQRWNRQPTQLQPSLHTSRHGSRQTMRTCPWQRWQQPRLQPKSASRQQLQRRSRQRQQQSGSRKQTARQQTAQRPPSASAKCMPWLHWHASGSRCVLASTL